MLIRSKFGVHKKAGPALSQLHLHLNVIQSQIVKCTKLKYNIYIYIYIYIYICKCSVIDIEHY